MYYPDVPALGPEDIELLCNEYIAHNKHLDPHIADRLGVKRGLRNPDGTGVLAGITNVSSVIGYEKLPEGTIRPISGRLVYRGIDIDTLAAEADKNDRFMFEEVVWLLLFGALPTQEQYARFCKLTVSGLLVVLIGLRMWGVPFLRRISPELTRPCRFRGKAFAVGLLTGLMPCGALSSMWIFAASSGSWASGAVSMLAFGAGTCVFMLLFGLLGTFLPKRYNKYLLKGSTILIVALGLILMTKGIRLLA